MNLTKLNLILPKSVTEQIPDVISKFNINTVLRLSHFLAQCAHESGNFKFVTENLNYSKNGLMKVFPKYFPNEQIAEKYERKPSEIAGIVYANRMGNSESSDSWKYIGRGYIQLTGKSNYAAFDKIVEDDILSNPGLVATKYPLLSAGWFWDSKKLNTLADKGSSDLDVTNITKKVNGGVNGLPDRISKFKLFYNQLM